MSKQPSTNGTNGDRDTSGRFAPGNSGGPGNPHARRVARLRTLILESVSDDDLKAIVGELVEQAKCADLAAIKLLFGYLIGKPSDAPDPDRLDVDAVMIEADQLEAERLRRTRKPNAMDELFSL